MALATDVISDQRLREAVGIVGNDQDTSLTAFRNSAIAIVEKWLGRNILDRPTFVSEPSEFGYSKVPDYILFFVPDIKAVDGQDDITLHYRNADDDPAAKSNQTMAFQLSDDRVGPLGQYRDGILIYSDGTDSWDGILRLNEPVPHIECSVGMNASDIPSPWGDAVALIVRALLDGSAYDEVSKMSILNVALGPWKRNAYMSSVR